MKYRQFVFAALLAGLCVVSASSVAQAYQQNYTCQEGPDKCAPGQDYAPIVWDHNCVLFYLDRAGSSDFLGGETSTHGPSQDMKSLEQVVRRAFDAWTSPSCGSVSLVYGGLVDADDEVSGQSRNVVSFQQEGWSHTSMTVFATTVVSYNPNTGVIHEADIKVNDEFYHFAANAVPGSGHADLQNTLTHEVGHFLGIAHSEVAEATMFGSAGLEETKKRTLHEDDVAVLCRYYPASKSDSVCETTLPSKPTDEGPLLPDPTDNPDTPDNPDAPDNPGDDGDSKNPIEDSPIVWGPGGPSDQGGIAAGGCNVTGGEGSATLPLWMPIFGLMVVGLVNRKWTFSRDE